MWKACEAFGLSDIGVQGPFAEQNDSTKFVYVETPRIWLRPNGQPRKKHQKKAPGRPPGSTFLKGPMPCLWPQTSSGALLSFVSAGRRFKSTMFVGGGTTPFCQHLIRVAPPPESSWEGGRMGQMGRTKESNVHEDRAPSQSLGRGEC